MLKIFAIEVAGSVEGLRRIGVGLFVGGVCRFIGEFSLLGSRDEGFGFFSEFLFEVCYLCVGYVFGDISEV